MSKVDEKLDDDQAQQPQPFKFYLRPDVTYKILTTKWGTFTLLGGLVYAYHFVWAITGVNAFTDISRLNQCAGNPQGDDSSAVYDTAIALVTAFHIVEWIRQTVFLTTALVGANLVSLFHVLAINIPYGFIAMLVAIITRYTESGSDCAEASDGLPKQPERGAYLGLQVLCIVLYVPMCYLHVLFFKIKGVEWLHEQYLAEDEDDD